MIPLSGSGGIVSLCNTPGQEQVLHVAGIDGRARERFRKQAPFGDLLQAITDESRVLAHFRSTAGAELVLIGLKDGSHQVLMSDVGLEPGRTTAVLSGDGTLLAFRRRIGGSSASDARTGLFVRVLATQQEIPVDTVPSGARCEFAGWTRERTLLYGCDSGRGSEMRRWKLDQSGNSKAEPAGLLPANIYPLGLLQNGTFLFTSYGTTIVDTYVVDLNPATGRVTSRPRRINSGNAGKSMYPLWFDRGRMISYYTFPPSHVVTKQFPDGHERGFPIGLQAGGHTWMPDGAAIFPGFKAGVGEGLFRVNLETGTTEPILLRSAGAGGFRGFRGGFPALSADGNIMFYRDDARHALVARNLKDSTERVLYEETGPPFGAIRSVHRSPDEKWLGFIVNRLQSNVLMVVPAAGGAARELCTARWPDEIHAAQSFSWMPDSKRILFVRRKGETPELWIVSIDKPSPRRTGFEDAGMRHLAVHPGGRSLAYAAGALGQMAIQSVELK